MRRRFLGILIAGFWGGSALAQDGIPAEFPPETYTAGQYIDSMGCVFVRVGVDDAVTWVPRVSRTREQICGQPPTFGRASMPISVSDQQSDVEYDIPQVTEAMTPVATSKPTTSNARTLRQVGPTKQVAAIASGSAPPKGYRPAWTDGRLNPNRAKGTAAGTAAMNRIWTQKVPRTLLPKPQTGRSVTTSSRNAPSARAYNHRLVQVGVFANPANADRVRARLWALGLPSTTIVVRTGGRVLQSIVAGPFDAGPDAQKRLHQIKSAGYRDAFLRK